MVKNRLFTLLIVTITLSLLSVSALAVTNNARVVPSTLTVQQGSTGTLYFEIDPTTPVSSVIIGADYDPAAITINNPTPTLVGGDNIQWNPAYVRTVNSGTNLRLEAVTLGGQPNWLTPGNNVRVLTIPFTANTVGATRVRITSAQVDTQNVPNFLDATITVTAAAPPAASEISCTDNNDNDADGLIDCADSDCVGNVACQNLANGARCDGNNMCQSGSCVNRVCTAAQVVTSETSCSNGLDDDGDGANDCVDSDCVGDAACQNLANGFFCFNGAMCQSTICNGNTCVAQAASCRDNEDISSNCNCDNNRDVVRGRCSQVISEIQNSIENGNSILTIVTSIAQSLRAFFTAAGIN